MPLLLGPYREIIYRSIDYENQEAGLESKYQDLPYGQRVYLGPTRPSVTRPHRRLGAPLAASPTRTAPPQSGGKREAPSKKGSQRASGDAKHRRAHKCPKGHYWSYKHNKCMKSKF